MTASRRVASCATCGAKLPKMSRYCPECGHPTAAGGTKVMEIPPDETGRVPVHYERAEPRYYGLTPTTLVLVLAAAALTLAIVLFVTGRWPFGLILVGVSLLLVLVFFEAASRKPDGAVARSTAEALDAFRARAGAAADSLATRGRAARRVLTLRRELQRMGLPRALSAPRRGEPASARDHPGAQSRRDSRARPASATGGRAPLGSGIPAGTSDALPNLRPWLRDWPSSSSRSSFWPLPLRATTAGSSVHCRRGSLRPVPRRPG